MALSADRNTKSRDAELFEFDVKVPSSSTPVAWLP